MMALSLSSFRSERPGRQALGMALALLVFAWAGLLGPGDTWAYGLICVLSGFALGADLALPPSLLADLLARPGAPQAPRAASGAAFGWWNFVTKANLALAAGATLPLLQWLGYMPGSQDPLALQRLAWIYALLPCALKLMAAWLLHRLLITSRKPPQGVTP